MKILHIAGTGIKGRSFAHDIQKPIVIFTGANGAGKTTRLQAVELALRGPKKDDLRFDGDKASCHVRMELPVAVHPGARAEILRGLGPKHTLAVQPLSKPGKPVTAAQAELDMLLQLPTVTFDLSAFTQLSADKQKSALLPFARHVDAKQYAGIYPSVAPFDGESGSDYLGRVRAAINEETKALSQRKLAAERAQVQLAENAGHSARPAAKIKEDIVAVQRAIDAVMAADALRVAQGALADVEARAATAGVMTVAGGKSAAELRAELNDVETQLGVWRTQATWEGLVNAAQADAQEKNAALEQALENLATAGGGVDYDESYHQHLLAQMDLHRQASAAYADAQRASGHFAAELANARFGQIEALALLAVLEAAPAPMPLHVGELRELLLRDGFPSATALQERMAQCDEAMKQAVAAMHPAAEKLIADGEAIERARMAAGITDSLRATAQAARLAQAHATDRLMQLKAQQPPAPTGTEQDHLRLLTRRDAVTAEIQFAIAEEQKAGAADAARKAVEADINAARARVEMAQAEYADKAHGVVIPDTNLGEQKAALQRELDDAVRAEGRVEAERGAYQDAESAKVALAAAKDAEKRAKEASDQCLRDAMGDVAEAFAPFCTMLGGSWRLGDKDPLGLERNGVWVGYDELSESERLVYGIGLVLALTTAGHGLRLVMLDGLDDCDIARRRAITAEAKKLVVAGKLDNVLGTAWNADGFDDADVQVIAV